jgi:hypothetical protein
MSSIDRVLIDPDGEDLASAVRAGIDAVNRDMVGTGHSLPYEADEAFGQLFGKMHQDADGVCVWSAPGPGPNGVRAALIAVWWADALGRRHLRLLGGCRHRGMELPLPIPSAHRPALACVYPEVCVIATQHRRSRLLAVCECGAWGRPERLAWMGDRCGPCFDRSEADPPPRRVTLRLGDEVCSLAFAPDGRLAVGTADSRVSLWDVEGPARPLGQWRIPPGKLAFDASGTTLACLAGPAWVLCLVRLDSPGDTVLVSTHDLRVHAFAFTPEPGGLVAQLSGPPPAPELRVVRGEAGEVRRWYEGEGRFEQRCGIHSKVPFRTPLPLECHDLAVSPDGRVAVAACGAQGLCFWDAHSGEPLHRADERIDCVGPLRWSPDGTALACGVAGRFWKAVLYDFVRRSRRAIIGGTARLNDFVFTPDGRWLLTAEQSAIRTWDAATGAERNAVTPGDDEARALAVSPDGGTVALAMRGGRVRLWPTELLPPEG